MSLQVVDLCKRLVTQLTLVGLLPGVAPRVSLQLVALGERLVA